MHENEIPLVRKTDLGNIIQINKQVEYDAQKLGKKHVAAFTAQLFRQMRELQASPMLEARVVEKLVS